MVVIYEEDGGTDVSSTAEKLQRVPSTCETTAGISSAHSSDPGVCCQCRSTANRGCWTKNFRVDARRRAVMRMMRVLMKQPMYVVMMICAYMMVVSSIPCNFGLCNVCGVGQSEVTRIRQVLGDDQ